MSNTRYQVEATNGQEMSERFLSPMTQSEMRQTVGGRDSFVVPTSDRPTATATDNEHKDWIIIESMSSL